MDRRRMMYVLAIFVILALAGVALAQQISATLMGVVKDKQGAVVPNAKVVLINQDQRTTVRELNSEVDGSFTIAPLQPATYTLTVEAFGFKKFEQKDIKLYANDRIAVPNIVLEVGAVTETVTVEAEAVMLKTESAEKSGVVTGVQVVNLALNGRNYLDLVKTVPGLQAVDFNGQVAGPGGIGNIYANGQRGDQNNVTLDGADNMDTGSNGTQHTSLNIDAIAEFKVITNSQPAEFGRAPGAAINVVTKAGTSDFHGTGYWFHRNEGLNAQTWRNNADGITNKKKYRYNYEGFNIGGPIYIPGKFNSDKTKLFFFAGYEWQEQLVPNNTRYVTVPTAAERQGDFSATHEGDSFKSLVTIKDPLNNGNPFPGNIIPKDRWNADGGKILNWYPMPNTSGFPGYNYQTQVSSSYPRRQLIVRGDWNINDKWRAYVRMIKDKDDQVMPYGQWNSDYNIPLGPLHFGQPGKSMILNVTTIVNPTLTNEFIFGPSMNKLDETPMTDAFARSKLGLSYMMPFPTADGLGLVQNWWFGGVSNQPLHDVGGFSGTPFLNYNDTFDFTDNLSKVYGRHQFKAGYFIERSRKDQTSTSSVSGNIYFDRDASNPGDTNWAFSNALLGNFQRLSQANVVLNGKYRYTNVEWYVSDVFKVTPKLTLDLGLRFYIVQPQYDAKLQTSSFNPALWNGSQAAKLWQRAINPATGKVGAYNPVTGLFGPATMIGALVDGTGQRVNTAYVDGIGMAGYHGYPRGLINGRNVNYAPRLGIAYSPMPKMVFRAGGGVFYERIEGNPIFDQLNNPPGTITPNLYYGNLATIGSTPGVLFPQGLRGLSIDGHLPTTYNYNIGVQRELPFAIMLDVGYAGSVSRHLANAFNINRPGFGSAWQPYSQDPTNPNPKFDGTTNLPVNFYRPYQGYGDITITQWGATSNYNSLQIGANRRLASNLQFGVAYTWSRVMGTAGGYGDGFHPTNARMYNYAPLSFDRTHYLVFNYIYNTPKVAKNSNFLDNPIGRGIFNNWVVSGITTMTTGAPASVGWNIAGMSNLSERWTGDPTLGARVAMTGTPAQLDRGQRTLYQWINPAAFTIPAKPSIGLDSAQRGYIHQPGDNNWDVSIFKNFPFSKDGKRTIEARLEMFNAPNHARFSGYSTGITFDSTGKVTNLPAALGGGGGRYGFGAINGARDPRIIQLAAKLYF